MYFYQFVTIRLILIGNICIFCPWKDLPGLLTINIEDIDFAKNAKSFKPYFSRWSRFKDFLNLSTWGILFGQEKIGKKVITGRHMHNVAKLSQRKIQFRNFDTASLLFNNPKNKSFTIKIRPISRANCVKCRVFVVLCYHYW